jgi:hypothetical protein
VLIGGFSAGALTACGPGGGGPPPVTSASVYTNNHHLPGVGYYHAPYRAWYPFPYNQYDPRTERYYHGGQWAAAPHQSVTNLSAPPPEVAARAESTRTDVYRGGFGSTGRRHSVYT